MWQSITPYSYILACLLILSNVSLMAQFHYDFESAETSADISGNQAAIVDNPDQNNNPSQRCAYYNKQAGNWKPFYIDFPGGVNIGDNDRLSFKMRTSTKGRVYIKIWDGGKVAKESWVRNYDFMPTPNSWTELTYDVGDLANQNITRVEMVASVDNNASADVYFDDIKLFNSESPNGEPRIVLNYPTRFIELGSALEMDASQSIDIDGEIVSFTWDLGDGTAIEQSSIISHVYETAGLYDLILTVRDNDELVAETKVKVWVYNKGEASSNFFGEQNTLQTNEKIELNFFVNKTFQNPYDPDEVEVNALITKPDGSQIRVPCFYYVEVDYMQNNWKVETEERNWMLRWSTDQEGVHQVQIECKEPIASFIGEPTEFEVSAGTAKGIIRQDTLNPQHYRHESGEPFFPMGINAAWDNIDNYTLISKNLANGGANIFRYWHAAFTNQVLEWKDGLGQYDPIASAKQDSIIELCKKNNIYLQMCIFHHGMFSETVNPNWSDSPYRKANGGPLNRPEEFFYNNSAKDQAKKLLRYIVARWGYSTELFAWELFNEVQWTGNHPNQSNKWKSAVIDWHDEMGKYIKSIDPFRHPVTTSADDRQLEDLAYRDGIDIIQYHTYPTSNVVDDMVKKDVDFLEITRDLPVGVICGEYGYNNDGDVPFDQQRQAIWTSLFSRVPHMIWRWQVHYGEDWTTLFHDPATFINKEDVVAEGNIQEWNLGMEHNGKLLKSKGFFTAADNYYSIIYDEDLAKDIAGVGVDFSKFKFGYYQLSMQDIFTGEMFFDEIEISQTAAPYILPNFTHGIALKAKFAGTLGFISANAGEDITIGKGVAYELSASLSAIPENLSPVYNWSVLSRPEGSNFSLENPTSASSTIIPDLPGIYEFELSVSDGGENVSKDILLLTVNDNPIAIAGDDIIVEPGERVTLNGRSSFDIENDRITYGWELIQQPAGSNGELLFTSSSRPILQTDLEGDYAIALTVADPYSKSSPDTVIVSAQLTTSVVNLDNGEQITLFPNPAQDYLHIDFSTFDIKVATLTINDLQGKELWRTNEVNTLTRINLEGLNLPKGMYILHCTNSSTSFNLPFLKK